MWDSQGICHSTDGSTVVALPIGGPSLMTGGDDLVYVQRTDAVLGPVLYATDGTVAGTRLLADWGSIHTSAAEAMYPLGTGNRILMAVRSDTGGVQPWISDGTPAGTVQLATLNPSGSSDPVLLGVAGDVSYLVADDGVVGAELWRLDLNQVGAAAVQELGVGCPGSAGEPRLRSGDTPGLGTTFEVRLSQARPNALAAWLIGWQIGAIPVGGGCTIYMQNLGTIATTLTDAAGASSFAITIPATVSLLGASLIEQVGVFDPLGVSPFGTATSAGIYWVVGG